MQYANEDIKKYVQEPFSAGRATGRLLFDFGVMASALKQEALELPILDFGSGTTWVSEFCARMGFKTVSFDINGELIAACLRERIESDRRIDSTLLSSQAGDGHMMPFETGTFGHVLVYDTLHHMHDYERVFSEFHRVLAPGGRAIFVEPGARHSKSPDTIAFVEFMRERDPTWIERDVVLEEIDAIARSAGFTVGLSIIPMPHPLAFQTYSMDDWRGFRSGDELQRLRFTDQLAELNYWDRVIFFVEKPN
jgi:SAM-dependent methyltransferase